VGDENEGGEGKERGAQYVQWRIGIAEGYWESLSCQERGQSVCPMAHAGMCKVALGGKAIDPLEYRCVWTDQPL